MLQYAGTSTVALHDTGVRVRLDNDRDIIAARHQARALAHDAGFGLADLAIIATAISELGQNVLRYARTGDLEIEIVHDGARRGIVIVASDRGPGIPDIDLALQDGYSTSGRLGLGLPGVRRLMDGFTITSAVGRGTTVTVTKWSG
jgi:serine/threonine-protein kinase RsbT